LGLSAESTAILPTLDEVLLDILADLPLALVVTLAVDAVLEVRNLTR